MPLFFKHNRGTVATYRLPWGAVAGAAIGLIGDQMKDDKNGGAGTQTNTKEPWLAAQPWLMQNLQQGQALQNRYTAEPFSPQQRQAYDNSMAQTDYMRRLTPSLLGQLSAQPTGYDPTNPLARQRAWDWSGNRRPGDPDIGQGSLLNAAPNPVAAPAPAPAAPVSDFVQQGQMSPEFSSWAQYATTGALTPGMQQTAYDQIAGKGTGKYGEFRYGQKPPERGTKAYRDMQEYFAYGGLDPANIYGRGDDSLSPYDIERRRALGLGGGGQEGPSAGQAGV